MIMQKFRLRRRFWRICACYNTTSKNLDIILNLMEQLEMPKEYLQDVTTLLTRNVINTAATYSNITTKTSIIVFLKTRNAQEFIDSFIHEILHLSNHIARAYEINVDGEEICYLAGDAAKTMYKRCHHLMCKHCNPDYSPNNKVSEI